MFPEIYTHSELEQSCQENTGRRAIEVVGRWLRSERLQKTPVDMTAEQAIRLTRHVELELDEQRRRSRRKKKEART